MWGSKMYEDGSRDALVGCSHSLFPNWAYRVAKKAFLLPLVIVVMRTLHRIGVGL